MEEIIYANEMGEVLEFNEQHPFLLLEVENTEAAEVDIKSTKAPRQDGETYHDSTLDVRTLVITGAIVGADEKDRYEKRKKISSILSPKMKGELIYRNPAGEFKTSAVPEMISWGDELLEIQKFIIQFYCPGSYWEGIKESKTEVATWIPQFKYPHQISAIHENYKDDDGQILDLTENNHHAEVRTVGETARWEKGAIYVSKDAYVTIPPIPDLLQNSFTIEIVLEPTEWNRSSTPIFSNRVGLFADDSEGVDITRTTQGAIKVHSHFEDTHFTADSITDPPLNEISTLAVVGTERETKIFINGKDVTDPDGNESVINPAEVNRRVYLQGRQNHPQKGERYIYNVRVYKRELKDKELKYNALQVGSLNYIRDESLVVDLNAGYKGIVEDQGFQLGYKQPSLIAEVNNTGDVPTGMRIEFTTNSEVQNPSLFDMETREYIKVYHTIKAGETIIVDTHFGQKRVMLKDEMGRYTDIFEHLDFGSTFLRLDQGTNYFRYDADKGIDVLEVNIYHKNLFVGV